MEKPQLLLMQIMAIENDRNISVPVHIYIYMCVCVCVCVCIYSIVYYRNYQRSKVARRTVETCGGSDLKAAKAQYSV